MIIECLIGCVIVITLWVLNRKPDGLPPGEWGWPVIGNLPSLKIPISDYIEKYIKKHGKTFTWRIGSRTIVFLCDYKIIKAAFNNPLLNIRPKLFSFDFYTEGRRLGSRYEVGDEKFQAYQKLSLEMCDDFQSSAFLMYDIFPWLDKLIPNKVKALLGQPKPETFQRSQKFKAFLEEFITEHKSSKEDDDKPMDLIDSYLSELKKNAEGKYSENTSTFSELELVYTLWDLFEAGTHTTSSTIKWTILYLIKYSSIQKKIQQQIDEVVPEHRLPGLEDREKLQYVEATIFEVMRIQTIAPLGAYHCAQEDTNIGNFRIPKGTVIISAIEACHLDPDYWENPQAFNPDRFLLPDGSVDSKKEGFIPFSIGRRQCPGEQLARMELFLFTSALLQKFSFSAPEGVDVVLDPDPLSPNFVMPKPFQMIMRERKPLSHKRVFSV